MTIRYQRGPGPGTGVGSTNKKDDGNHWGQEACQKGKKLLIRWMPDPDAYMTEVAVPRIWWQQLEKRTHGRRAGHWGGFWVVLWFLEYNSNRNYTLQSKYWTSSLHRSCHSNEQRFDLIVGHCRLSSASKDTSFVVSSPVSGKNILHCIVGKHPTKAILLTALDG